MQEAAVSQVHIRVCTPEEVCQRTTSPESNVRGGRRKICCMRSGEGIRGSQNQNQTNPGPDWFPGSSDVPEICRDWSFNRKAKGWFFSSLLVSSPGERRNEGTGSGERSCSTLSLVSPELQRFQHVVWCLWRRCIYAQQVREARNMRTAPAGTEVSCGGCFFCDGNLAKWDKRPTEPPEWNVNLLKERSAILFCC